MRSLGERDGGGGSWTTDRQLLEDEKLARSNAMRYGGLCGNWRRISVIDNGAQNRTYFS
jgi:hypothetical protein